MLKIIYPALMGLAVWQGIVAWIVAEDVADLPDVLPRTAVAFSSAGQSENTVEAPASPDQINLAALGAQPFQLFVKPVPEAPQSPQIAEPEPTVQPVFTPPPPQRAPLPELKLVGTFTGGERDYAYIASPQTGALEKAYLGSKVAEFLEVTDISAKRVKLRSLKDNRQLEILLHVPAR